MRTNTYRHALMVIVLSLILGGVAWAEGREPASEPGVVSEVAIDPSLEMGVTENAKGTVYYYDERRPEVWATIGLRDGLRPDAIIAFCRKGEIVAEGCVKESRNSDCTIYPAPGTPSGTILVGDDVRVLLNGPREALDAKIRREHGDQKLGSFAAFALLFGHIWAVRY